MVLENAVSKGAELKANCQPWPTVNCQPWPTVNPDSYLCSVGVIFLSGYNKLPTKKMDWEDSPDAWSPPLVTTAIRRDYYGYHGAKKLTSHMWGLCDSCAGFSSHIEHIRASFTDLDSFDMGQGPDVGMHRGTR